MQDNFSTNFLEDRKSNGFTNILYPIDLYFCSLRGKAITSTQKCNTVQKTRKTMLKAYVEENFDYRGFHFNYRGFGRNFLNQSNYRGFLL